MGFKHSRIAKPFSNFSICLLSPEGLGAWLDSLRKCNNCITSTTSKVAYFFQSLPLQDNYTLAQPGIQTKIMRLKDLIARLDGVCVCGRVCVCRRVCWWACVWSHWGLSRFSLARLSGSPSVQPLGGVHPVFLPLDEQPPHARVPSQMYHQTVGLLPCECSPPSSSHTHLHTYFTGHVCDLLFQSERNGFATFHVYVCAALLKWFSDDIQAHKDFQVLNQLPTCWVV